MPILGDETITGLLIASISCAAPLSCADRAPEAAACDAEDAEACHRLGVMQLEGVGGGKDKRKAEESLKRACRLGRAASCGLLGRVLYARKDERSRDLLTRACEGGHLPGCVTAGWMRWWGEGGEMDRAGARRFLDKACGGREEDGCAFRSLLDGLDEGGEP
jgi:TPR repeat protein